MDGGTTNWMNLRSLYCSRKSGGITHFETQLWDAVDSLVDEYFENWTIQTSKREPDKKTVEKLNLH